MTFTVWSNAGKFEWIAWAGDTVFDRSGLIFKTYKAAMRDLMKTVKTF